MKRALSALTIAVLGAGLAIVGATAPASASTPAVSASCISLDVNLSGYATEPGVAEVTEERIVTPAVDEVSHTDYVYKAVFGSSKHVSHSWQGNNLFYDWTWYRYTGENQKHIEVPAKPAVTETVVVTEAVPANPTPNTVTVEIAGEVLVDGVAFGETFAQDFDLDKYTEQAYKVTVTSYDGEGGGVWEGTSPACALGDWNAKAVIDTDCGSADVTVTNPALAENLINATYAAVVYIDGTATDFIASVENGTEKRTYTFPEDSGDHTVVVRTGPAQGDVELDRATVTTDCIVTPVPAVGTLSVSGELVPGGAITVDGVGFEPSTEYDLELHSTPQALGTVTTDGNGDFSLDGTIGETTPAGAHDVVVLLDGDRVTSTGITVTAAPTTEVPGTETPGTETPTTPATSESTTAPAAAKPASGLADTGFESTTGLLLALALLVLGGAAFGVTRVVRSRA